MTATTVGELLDLLADLDPETPVMIAHQPSWPLAEGLAGVVYSADTDSDDDDPDTDDECVWLVAGGHQYGRRSPYAPGWVFDAVQHDQSSRMGSPERRRPRAFMANEQRLDGRRQPLRPQRPDPDEDRPPDIENILVVDASTRKTPTWAVVLAVLGIFFFLLGLLFLLVKETVPRSRVTIYLKSNPGTPVSVWSLYAVDRTQTDWYPVFAAIKRG